jgi:hypothetical protein
MQLVTSPASDDTFLSRSPPVLWYTVEIEIRARLSFHTAVCWFYRKPYASAQCVRAAGDSSTLTMIK